MLTHSLLQSDIFRPRIRTRLRLKKRPLVLSKVIKLSLVRLWQVRTCSVAVCLSLPSHSWFPSYRVSLVFFVSDHIYHIKFRHVYHITLHYILSRASHYITLHSVTCITLHDITFCHVYHITLHYILSRVSHYITLHSVTCITSHYITFRHVFRHMTAPSSGSLIFNHSILGASPCREHLSKHAGKMPSSYGCTFFSEFKVTYNDE